MVVFATDLGAGVTRPFEKLKTASDEFFGAHHASGFSSIWRVEGGIARRHSVPNALGKANCHFQIPNGADVLDIAKHLVPALHTTMSADGWCIEPLNLPIGSSFPRLARPHHQHPGDFPTPKIYGDYPHERAAAIFNAVSLVSRLTTAFQFVDPDPKNDTTFGTEFRNILILSATEFEAQCKGILRANSYDTGDDRYWKTTDYVKIEMAARLGDYSIRFSGYPWIDPISPFKDWDAGAPIKSLDWYDAYNDVKHDREQHFQSATVRLAIRSVAAVSIIGLAQYGIDFFRRSSLGDVLEVVERPAWSIGDTDGKDHERGTPVEAMNYPFQ